MWAAVGKTLWCLPPAGTEHSYSSDGMNAGVSREIHPKRSVRAGQAAPSFSMLCDRSELVVVSGGTAVAVL